MWKQMLITGNIHRLDGWRHTGNLQQYYGECVEDSMIGRRVCSIGSRWKDPTPLLRSIGLLNGRLDIKKSNSRWIANSTLYNKCNIHDYKTIKCSRSTERADESWWTRCCERPLTGDGWWWVKTRALREWLGACRRAGGCKASCYVKCIIKVNKHSGHEMFTLGRKVVVESA